MFQIHFLSSIIVLLIGLIWLSSTSFGESQINDDGEYYFDTGYSGNDDYFDNNRINPYEDYVENARQFNSESMDAASQSMTDLSAAIEGQELSPWVLKSLVFGYVKEVTNMSQKIPNENASNKNELVPSFITERNFTEEEVFCTNLMKLTSELLNMRNQEAWERIRGRGRDDIIDSPVNMLEFMDRIINTTVSEVVKYKSQQHSDGSGAQMSGIFFESDEMIVEFESGGSNYTNDDVTRENSNVIVISTHYKTIGSLINQSANKSHYHHGDKSTNHHHNNARYCRKWQLSPKLCKMATDSREGAEAAPTVKLAADSDILSINAFVDGRKRSLPVHMNFRHDPARDREMMTSPNESVVPLCVFFDTNIHAWSDEGCAGVVGDDFIVTCRCNHTTTFALLLLVSAPNRFDLDDIDKNCMATFRMISFIAEGVSIIFLTCALVIFLIIAMTTNKQIERITIHTHLTISLLLFNIVLFSDHLQEEKSHHRECHVIALIIQFSLLSTFFWMLVEAWSLHRHVTGGSGSGVKMGSRKYLVGWGLPFCVTCTTLAIGIALNSDFTMEDDVRGSDVIHKKSNGMTCYLNEQLNWATFIPVFLVMVANLLALFQIFVLVVKLTNETRDMQPSNTRRSIHETHLYSVKKGMTSLMKLFPILGIPWIIALAATFVSSAEVFCYLSIIHSLLSGSQGIIFFIVCVVQNEENRKIFQRNWKKLSLGFAVHHRTRSTIPRLSGNRKDEEKSNINTISKRIKKMRDQVGSLETLDSVL